MYTIQTVRQLTADILLMDVYAPRVAANCLPGQFLIVRLGDKGERIPLTICDYDRNAQTVTIVFQVVGASTAKMAKLKAGDAFDTVMGPLGNPSDLTHETTEALQKKHIVFVAGGVGTAPVYPQIKYLHERGISCDCIIGAREKSLLILTDEIRAMAEHAVARYPAHPKTVHPYFAGPIPRASPAFRPRYAEHIGSWLLRI